MRLIQTAQVEKPGLQTSPHWAGALSFAHSALIHQKAPGRGSVGEEMMMRMSGRKSGRGQVLSIATGADGTGVKRVRTD